MADKSIWKIQYLNLCITEFAKKRKMLPIVSYRYLASFGGLGFLDRNYEAEHVLPLQDTLNTLVQVCRRNGGTL